MDARLAVCVARHGIDAILALESTTQRLKQLLLTFDDIPILSEHVMQRAVEAMQSEP